MVLLVSSTYTDHDVSCYSYYMFLHTFLPWFSYFCVLAHDLDCSDVDDFGFTHCLSLQSLMLPVNRSSFASDVYLTNYYFYRVGYTLFLVIYHLVLEIWYQGCLWWIPWRGWPYLRYANTHGSKFIYRVI